MKRADLDALTALSRKERQRIRALALERRDTERARKHERAAARKRRNRRDAEAREWTLLDFELAVFAEERARTEADAAGAWSRVTWIWSGGCIVRGPDDVEVEARLVSRIAEVQRSALAVGDRVLLERRAHDWVVTHVDARRSQLSRPDPLHPNIERVVAANVDQILVVCTPGRPPFRPGLLDRYWVAGARGNVALRIVLNKVDDGSTAELRSARTTLASYAEAGLPVLETSALERKGLDALRAAIGGTCFALVGQSGVGKSSLANALAPGLDLRVGEVSTAIGKGRHTTTSASLHALGDDTWLIDTPGIRAFGLWQVDRSTLEDAFADIAREGASCRFSDCTHTGEPGCAVRAAADDGRVAVARYRAWQRLLSDTTPADD